MITCYQTFLQNYSTPVHPLNELLRKGMTWSWTEKCQSIFEELKEKLSRAPVLAHYNPQLPLKLDTDASAHGVGAVISHVLSNGQEHPVAYASGTLSKSEQNYSQVEREALAIIFAVKKFYCYLFGWNFRWLLTTNSCAPYLDGKPEFPLLQQLECKGGLCFCRLFNMILCIGPQQSIVMQIV